MGNTNAQDTAPLQTTAASDSITLIMTPSRQRFGYLSHAVRAQAKDEHEFLFVDTVAALESATYDHPDSGVLIDVIGGAPCDAAINVILALGLFRPLLALVEPGDLGADKSMLAVGGETYAFDPAGQDEADIARAWQQAKSRFQKLRSLMEQQDGGSPTINPSLLGHWCFPYDQQSLVLSPSCYLILGRSPEEFSHTVDGLMDCIHPKDRALAEVDNVAGTSRVLRIIWPDGQIRHVSVISVVERGEDGNKILAYGMMQDVTIQQIAAHKLQESQANYEGLFFECPVALLENDFTEFFECIESWRAAGTRDLSSFLQKNPDKLKHLARCVQVRRINATAHEVIGVDNVEDITELRLFETENALRALKLIAEAFWQGDDTFSREIAQTDALGDEKTIAFAMRIPKSVEEAHSVPVAAHDVSDAYKAEDMRLANVAKSRFLANMSHEIRTPLNAVIGHLELLGQDDLTDDQRDRVTSSRTSANTLLALIGDILDFSKIEANEIVLEPRSVNLSSLISECLDMLQSNARTKGIFVSSFVHADVPEEVTLDGLRLTQILLNLLTNAIKFTDRGGVHLVVDADLNDPANLTFAVHDSGKGIARSELDNIFNSFAQEDETVTREFGGTGLGLSIAKKLAMVMGGDIEVDSRPGNGTTFIVTVGIEDYATSQTTDPDLSGQHVVIVEDHGRAWLDLSNLYKDLGAHVSIVEDAEQALQLCSPEHGVREDEFRNVTTVIFCEGAGWIPTMTLTASILEAGAMPAYLLAGPRTRSKIRTSLRAGLTQFYADPIDRPAIVRTFNAQISAQKLATEAIAQEEQHNSVMTNLQPDQKRVLVVEDRPTNRDILSLQLKKLGLPFTMAHDGVDGLDKVVQERFALVLSDLSMPRMSGLEFARRVRAQAITAADGKPIPIVAMTANVFRDDVVKTQEAGMDDFLAKPVTLPALEKVVKDWIGRGPLNDDSPGSFTSEIEPGDENQTSQGGVGVHVIDVGFLSDMIGDDNPETIRNIVHDFLDATAESWLSVESAVTEQNLSALSDAAHGGKGEARSAGAQPLAELYEEIEHAARDSEAWGDLVPSIKPYAARFEQERQNVEALIQELERKGEA